MAAARAAETATRHFGGVGEVLDTLPPRAPSVVAWQENRGRRRDRQPVDGVEVVGRAVVAAASGEVEARAMAD